MEMFKNLTTLWKEKIKHLFSQEGLIGQMFQTKTIQKRFVVPVLTALVLTLVLAEAIKFGFDIRGNYIDLQNKGKSLAELASISLVEPIWNFDEKAIASSGMALFKDNEVSQIKVFDSSGKVVFEHHAKYKGNSDIITEKGIGKEGKNIGRIQLGVTRQYRDALLFSNFLIFLVKLLIVCFILWYIINRVAGMITAPIREVTTIAERIANDDLSGEIVVRETGDEIGELISAFYKMQRNLRGIAQVARRIADGQLDDNDEVNEVCGRSGDLSDSFKAMLDNLKAMIGEIATLIDVFEDGRLDVRGDASKLKGGYREIVQGINSTMDALIRPIHETSNVLQELAKGNLKVEIKSEYRGDYAAIKNALNGTIENLSDQISEISMVLTEMSRGNLDVSIEREYQGDFNGIKNALSLIIDSFNKMLGEINALSEKVAVSSGQISESSSSLAQGSTEQAAAIEEISATVTEISTQTSQNAENAAKGSQLAITTKDYAQKGNTMINEMVQAMEETKEVSDNISHIIKVIDEIAFQTKILALNAAVEAARAGQYGRGFAVVADEVRNLAARSAEAAKDTSDLIENSVKKILTATNIAHNNATALQDIVDMTSKVAIFMDEIAAASNEQATGIQQVMIGLSQVSEVTQNSTAITEETASSSEEMSNLARTLRAMVNQFQLKKLSQPIDLGSVSPEVVELVQKMLREKENTAQAADPEKKAGNAKSNKKIRVDLKDNEFGKY